MLKSAFTVQILQDFGGLWVDAALALQTWKPWQSLG